jgi:CRISPR-associated endonuclease Csn1
MEKILGLDLGTNSIGWAIREVDNELENQITAKGVLTFEKGVATKEGKEFPKVQKRTESRGKRRNYQAEKYRKWELLDCLIENKMCPLTPDELNEWRHYKKGVGRKYPQRKEFIEWLHFDFDGDGKPDFDKYGLTKHDNCYAFRWLAVSDKNEHKKYFSDNKQLLGRVFYQLVQRRGFFNSGDAEETKLIEEGRPKKDSTGKVIKGEIEVVGIKVIDQLIKEKYKTLGTALFWGQKNKELEAINHYRIRNRFTYRHYFENEVDAIFENLGFDLKSDFCKRIKKAITWQRPLRSQKGLVGYCTLERPLKSKTGIYYKPGKKRIPLSHPLYEEFRTWVDINNLKIEPPIEVDKIAFLENQIFQIFNRASDLTYNGKKDKKTGKQTEKGIKERIFDAGGTIMSKFDIDLDEENEGKKYKANILLNKIEKIFGHDWKELLRWNETLSGKEKTGNYLRVEDIWHLIFDASVTKQQTTDLGDRLIPILQKHFPAITFDKKDFDSIRLNNGYASLSAASIRIILPYLKQGMLYSHAVFVANMETVFGKKLDTGTIEEVRKEYADILTKHKSDKEINSIVNGLISDRMNERDRINMGNDYVLDEIDIKDVNDKIKENFKSKTWNKKTTEQQAQFIDEVSSLYQNYLRLPMGIDKGKQFLKLYRIEDKITELLKTKYQIPEDRINKYLWHPSEQEVYSPANIKADKDGIVYQDEQGNDIFFLGDPNPISRGFKNPMAMKTLHYLKKLLNYLLQKNKINAHTKIVVEIARELNDTNTRKAIKKYQDERARLREAYKKKIAEHFDELGDTNKNISPEMIDRYELWEEQNKKCMYCSNPIECTDIMNGTAQIEHTIPAGISQCNELFNLTIAHPTCNAKKAKRYPTQWTDNYELILHNIKFMYAKVMSFKEKHEATYAGAKKAATKESKDSQIQDRHYYKQHLIYWQKKYETFTIEEVTNQFRRQQLIDTQIITKYALPWLKTVFKKVEPQKGLMTADFRKIYKIQDRFEGKERIKHSHHAIDAAVLTLIPPASIRDFIRKEYYVAKEKNISYHSKPKNWDNFNQQYILSIEDEVLNNYQVQNRTLTPTTKYQRKRGYKVPIKVDNKIIYQTDEDGNLIYKKNEKGELEYKRNHLGELLKDEQGNNIPIPLKKIKKSQGDTIRGQLHADSFYAAIKQPEYEFKDDKFVPVTDGKGGFIFQQNDKREIKDNIFIAKKILITDLKTYEDLEIIIDPNLRYYLQKTLLNKEFAKEILHPIWAFGIKEDRNGNPINPIRHIRCKVKGGGGGYVANPATIRERKDFQSNKPYKNKYYAQNGETAVCALYESVIDGKIIRELQTFSILDIAGNNGITSIIEVVPLNIEKTIKKTKHLIPLIAALQLGQRVLFYQNEMEELRKPNEANLGKRLYVIVKFEDGRISFKHHLNAMKEDDLGKEMKRLGFASSGASEFDFKNPIPKLRLSQGSLNMAIENKHFNIKPDGEIKWKY